MVLKVNGKNLEFAGGTVAELLAHLKIQGKNVVVEKNRAIVHREAYGAEPLADGDAIELVRFVGGG
jgi:sulfur carrier protein